MKKLCRLAFAILLLALTAQGAFAAQFPSKSIKVIVPFAPGGGVDVTVRMMVDLAPKYLNGQQLIVENMPGGGSVIGITAAAKAAPDGYTLLAYTPIAVSSVITKKTSYTTESFIPLTLYCLDPTILVVKADSPHKNLKGFIAAAKAKPLSVNTAGHSNTQHIGGMIMEKQLGFKFNYVHSTSGGLQITQLLGGHVDAALMSLGEVSSYLKDGSLRCIGLMSDKEFPGLPAMERFSSVGLKLDKKNIEWGSLRGLAAVAGTPAADLAVLDKGFANVVKDPVFIERMKKADFPYIFMNSAEFSAYMKTVEGVLREMLAAAK